MRKITFWFVLIVFFGASKLDAQQLTQKSTMSGSHSPNSMYLANQIIPGQAIGLLKLNADIRNTLESMGTPDDEDAAMGKAIFTWYAFHNPEKGKIVVYGEKQMGMSNVEDTMRIKQVRVTSSWFTTVDSIKVGVPLKDIQKLFSLEKEATFTEKGKQYSLYHTGQGISFEVNANGICSGIVIHDSTSDPLSTYMPFYSDVKK